MDYNGLKMGILCLFKIRQYQNDDNAALVKQLQAELRTSRMENVRLRNRFQEWYNPILSEFLLNFFLIMGLSTHLLIRTDSWKRIAGFPMGWNCVNDSHNAGHVFD